ncbi:YqaE/Pmp3 family membrane protein [Halomonas sp. HNIBRBA4712]|uniref:YqaE/Pmp3 family membrane protein n=1 Tax=Halomonas sp. HNIBRBA4712 TaxID=3373087 RepID=UPI003745BC8C
MDAREYLNRKGVGVERDPDRPNTLEEKAWERARGSGGERPKSGTPHDWEDWERFHAELADDAATLEQKIDKEAHRKAVERERREERARAEPVSRGGESREGKPREGETGKADPAPGSTAAVEHFTPAPKEASAASNKTVQERAPASVPDEPAGLKAAYAALCVLLPPLGVGLAGGKGKQVAIALVLTLLGWIPGVIYALAITLRR